MTKYCSFCGKDNDDNSTFCRNCGERLSGMNSINSDNKGVTKGDNKVLIGVIIILLIIIAIVGTYAFVTLNNENSSDISSGSSVGSIFDSSISSVSDVSGGNTKSWHKVDSFNGVGDYEITFNNNGGSRIKIVSSAMPIKNYADNNMYTTVSKNGYNVGSSQLSWNSKSAVATKSDNIEFSGSGTYYISISAYELQYWNLEIYEYY
nr:zinc ribbon domain-containing protein [Methanobrevibacter arboriphilus]